MPRIDPDRLLKTLAPLLEPNTGAVKSDKEVDKIYGLMSKFSKKLVSKCTYINILKSSKPDVLDLFFQRGGWDMVYGWTTEAYEKKNHELLKEIADLLLYAPATVQRLRENDLPKLVKTLSRDCENEELKKISKRIVDKWVSIAQQQENRGVIVTHPSVDAQTQLISSSVPNNNGSVESSEAKIENGIPISSSETAQSDFYMDLNMDLNDLDFNPEDFSKVVDQHFTGSDQNTAPNPVPSTTDVTNSVVVPEGSVNSTSVIQPNPQAASTNFMITSGSTDGAANVVSKLTIKTVDGKKAVVQGVTPPEPEKQQIAPYYLIMKDGKPFLVRMKLATQGELPSAVIQQTTTLNMQTLGANPQISVAGDDKKKRPRKDPSITATKSGVPVPTGDEKHRPNILKTYSKKNPVDGSETDGIGEGQQDPNSKSKPSSESPSKNTSGEKKTSSSKKSRPSSSSKSAAAVAAAKKLEDEDKLREKIKLEKLNLKKRQKEVAKQKQQEKDQETLKKLNLSAQPSVTSSSPSSSKIPKIPKKSSSFADAIGIPGATDTAIPVKDKSTKSNNSKSKIKSDDSPSKQPEAVISGVKFYGRKEDDSGKKGEEKERKHPTVKVFSSKKSRSDGLLKDMTETVKPNKSSKSDESGDKGLAKTAQKPEKRPSIEGIEKPGELKKAKMSQDEKRAQKEKAKADGRQIKVIKESSLFMDALIGSSDTQKEKKRKRRPSLTTEKDVVGQKPTNRANGGAAGKDLPTPTELTSPEAVKPVFNFYRDTLADTEISSPKDTVEETVESSTANSSMEVDEVEYDDSPADANDNDSTTEFKLKSALVIHRSKNKPKKSVRWREDDEIKEVFTFEMDETERVNVTRQNKDFSSMKELEKAEEKQYLSKSLKQRILGNEEEERMPWRRPFKLIVDNREFPPNSSEEKEVQEERERLNLGVFLPPGSLLPDSAAEPDPLSPDRSDDITETRIIPVDDVPNVTKAFDKSDIPWPEPKDRVFGGAIRPNHIHNVPPPVIDNTFGMPGFGIGTAPLNVPSHLNVNTNLPVPGFNPIPNGMDFSNPWSLAGVPPPTSALPGMNDIPNFNQLPGNPNPMAMFPTIPPPANPFSIIPNFSHPPPPVMGFPPSSQVPLLPNPANNINNFNRGHLGRGDSHNSQQGRGGHARDFGDRDHRRPYNRDNRDDRSSRGNYDSRGRSSRDHRSRDYERDRRSPSPTRRRRDDRERDRHSGRDTNDSRDREYRSRGRSGKTEIQCKFFIKGYCQNGARCEFLHGQDSSSKHNSRDRNSPPTRTEDTESDSPVEITSQFERRPSREDMGATNFTDAPSSPPVENEIMEDPSLLLPPGISEPAKIIPVE